jgi:polyisoprenoid-binding protein YceI
MTIFWVAPLYKYGPIIARIIMLGVILAVSPTVARSAQIDSTRSVATIRVFKSGLFSGFAHDHVIRAPIKSGSIDVHEKSIALTFQVADMQVLDPGASESERKDIDATMKGPKVLDGTQFPVVTFTSNSVKTSGADHIEVAGTLQIHGVSRPIMVPVASHDGTYTGSLTLKQTDYGITPVKIAGGAVRVRDEITVEFTVVPTSASAAN